MSIGNDVVDLVSARRMGSSRERRFAERVLYGQERELLRSARLSSLALWAIWAAKESAFKAAERLSPGQGFLARGFEVRLPSGLPGEGDAEPGSGWGEVRDRDCCAWSAFWTWTSSYVHCLAIDLDFEGRVTLRIEPVKGYGADLSKRARECAQRVLADEGASGCAIMTGQTKAPMVIRGVCPAPELVLSLSHDVRFVAAAVARIGA